MNAILTQEPKVVNINNDEASYRILSYLDDKKRKSENTYKNYVRYYTEFFGFVANKQISQITWEDIFKVTYAKVDDFKKFLLNKGDSPNYVNQKLFAGKSLWKKLYMVNHEVDTRVFDFEEEKIEKNNFGSFDHKEMELMFAFMEKETYKPKTKRMFFEFLYIVGCRKNVATDLEWSNITRQHDFKNNIDIWVVKYDDKGQTIEKAINDDFYNKLIELKTIGESTGDKVFDINKETIEIVFKKFQDEYNLHEKHGKTICIHSIKKASGWLVQNTFGDLNKTRKHLQHKNIQLTASIYMGDENYSEQASFMIGKDINTDFLKGMDKEDIIKLLESCGKDVIMKMYYANKNNEQR